MPHTQLAVADITIKIDGQGRYCLNDLQRAAMIGDPRSSRTFELNEFMRRPTTIELIAEIENTGNSNIKAVSTQRGRNGGTYVVKELVYAYAMWISPAFHLKIIRTYDELMAKGVVMRPQVAQAAVENPEAFLAQAVLLAQDILKKAQQKLVGVKPGVSTAMQITP